MFFYAWIFIPGIISLASAAALNPAGKLQARQSAVPQTCPVVTINNYITITATATVTVTDIPDVVTIAVPNYSAISSSLASAFTVDSIVAIESIQDRPVHTPMDTRFPTFVESIYAPAVEVTEASHIGTSVFYLPGTHNPSTIVIGATTTAFNIGGSTDVAAGLTSGSPSVFRQVSSQEGNFTVPTDGWNGTQTSSTNPTNLFGTGNTASREYTNTSTVITYVSTTTSVVYTTITAAPIYEPPPQYSYSGWAEFVKRQTCVVISAEIGGSWVSWCNNWDGSTTYTYTSWETTIIPGHSQASESDANPSSPITFTSTQPTTITIIQSGPATTVTTTMVTVPPADSSPAPSPAPSVPSPCGEIGDFTIGFDDLPQQSVFNNATAGLPPIFNPFKHFYWSGGWSYVPPPSVPYPPHSGQQLAIFTPSPSDGSPDSDLSSLPPGGFGAGWRSPIGAYWFGAQSAWIGCQNNLADPTDQCDFVAEGYHYDNVTNTNRIHITQHFSQPLCHSETCTLQQIFFNDQFTQLTAMGFYAKIGGGVHTFYVDDLALSWWDNSCEAGLLRASSRK